MERRRSIRKSWIIVVIVCLIGGWVVWMSLYQSGSWVRESPEMTELKEREETENVREEESSAQMNTSGEESTVTQKNQFEEKAETQHSNAVVSPSVNGIEDKKDSQSPEKQISLIGLQKKLVNFGFEKSARKAQDIDTVVLHSSFNNQGGDRYSVEKVISIWKNYGVAPHFVIDRKGNIVQLVSEHNIAYHAGVSEMKDGRKNVNDFSLGVEILNAEDDTYTEAQYTAVKSLVAYLKKTYPIKYVVGHDAIAPGRKTDPWNFDWKKLAIK